MKMSRKTDEELEELRGWVELTEFLALTFALHQSSESQFNTQPNRKALRERALEATTRALAEVKDMASATADFGFSRLSAFSDKLSEANTLLYRGAEDCSQTDLLSEFASPIPMEM